MSRVVVSCAGAPVERYDLDGVPFEQFRLEVLAKLGRTCDADHEVVGEAEWDARPVNRPIPGSTR